MCTLIFLKLRLHVRGFNLYIKSRFGLNGSIRNFAEETIATLLILASKIFNKVLSNYINVITEMSSYLFCYSYK